MTVAIPEQLVGPGELDFCDLCFPTVREPGEWVCSNCETVGCTRYQSNHPGHFDHSVGYFMCRNHQYRQQVGHFKPTGLGWPRA